jgi:hypothetical protein
MQQYEVIEYLPVGLLGLRTPRDGKQLWVRAEKIPRGFQKCIRCGRDTTDVEVYRPFGNPRNRSARMCKPCVEELIAEKIGYLVA